MGLVISAASDGLRTPSPRRCASWRWACAPWVPQVTTDAPRVLHEALHEGAGTWGSHRGSGWGWAPPRVGAWPSMGAAEGCEVKATVGGSCLPAPPGGGAHGQAGAQSRACRWVGSRAGSGGGHHALERGPTPAPSQLASVFTLRTPPQTHPRTQARVHRDPERSHSKSKALCWGPSPSWASNPSPQPGPSSPLPGTSGSARPHPHTAV